MQNLYNNCLREYSNELEKIKKENEDYLAENKVRRRPKDIGNFTFQKNIIPMVSPIPSFRLYTYISQNIGTQDDPVLRYTPFIDTEERYIELSYYERTKKEYVLNRDEELNNRMINKATANIDKSLLFKMLVNEDRTSIDAVSILDNLSQFTGLSIKSILKRWEIQQHNTSFYDDWDAFRLYFCNICLLFDCNIHDNVDGEIEKVDDDEKFIIKDNNQEVENDNINSSSQSPFLTPCSLTCYLYEKYYNSTKNPKSNHHDLFNSNNHFNKNQPDKNHSDKSHSDKNHSKEVNPFKEKAEIQKLEILPVKRNLLILIYKLFKVTPCQALKIYNAFSNTQTNCISIYRFINHLKINQRKILKKQPTKQSTLRSIRYNEIYVPCTHSGTCIGNKNCRCATNRIFCEKYCMCECCNNIFTCKCTECGISCPCMSNLRECNECNCLKCDNRSIQLNKEKKTYVDESKIAGFGLFAGELIKINDFVIEYIGEVITNEEAERRGIFYEEKKLSYLFDLNNKGKNVYQTIDATRYGNKARFINHSSNPNLKAKTVQVNGTKRIAFYALKNINKDEELFFNYNYKEEYKKKYNIKD